MLVRSHSSYRVRSGSQSVWMGKSSQSSLSYTLLPCSIHVLLAGASPSPFPSLHRFESLPKGKKEENPPVKGGFNHSTRQKSYNRAQMPGSMWTLPSLGYP